ncbi:MAG: AraC family transcriptional regulator [Eubacteriales bacterium]|nr:AraC family transcriptional regulator [Eubacteriales bacterium]
MQSYGVFMGGKMRIGNRLEESFADWMTAEFPVTVVDAHFHDYPNRVIPWHWHREFEVFYITSGSIRYRANQEMMEFSEGEGGFLNSNVLHSIEPGMDSASDSFFVAIVHSDLLAGAPGSAIDTKYIRPMQLCEKLPMVRFPKGDGRLEQLKRIAELMQGRQSGYELRVRSLLSEIWMKTYEQNDALIHSGRPGRNLEQERVKSMLTCIEDGYAHKLELREIAAAANISERECLRCFRRNVGCTPFEYLINYRIQRAAMQLIQTDRPILEVALSCGFSTGSYFGKKFREVMQCTPRQYRERHRQ